MVRRADDARLLAVVLLAAVVRRADDARRLAVVRLAVVLRVVDARRLAVVRLACCSSCTCSSCCVERRAVVRRALDVVRFAAVLLERVRLELPAEDLPKSLRRSDLILDYSLGNIKALCGFLWELLKTSFENIIYGFGVIDWCRIC